MNLRQAILKEHSMAQRAMIVKWVGRNQQRFDELFSLFLKDEYRVVQRAAWPVSYCVEAHPGFIKKHFSKLISNLQQPGLHDAVKRNTMRLLQFVELPKKYHGEVMDICFRYISSPAEAVAIKAYSLSVLQQLAQQYPEIRQEIKLIIEERWEQETAAFRSRAKKILSSFSTVNKSQQVNQAG